MAPAPGEGHIDQAAGVLRLLSQNGRQSFSFDTFAVTMQLVIVGHSDSFCSV